LIEVAIATLATDRALLLLGVPGRPRAGSRAPRRRDLGDSTLLVQGPRHSEESIRYGWNYARLLADGPSKAAIVASR